MFRRSLLKHFDLDALGQYRGAVHETMVGEIVDAVEAREMLAVVAPFGSGKTELLKMAERESDALFVRVNSPDKERMRMPSIMGALVYGVTDYAVEPKAHTERRAVQLVHKILGPRVVGEGRDVCLVIENAHRLDPSVLMAVKDFREHAYRGVSPLISVVLVGQPPLRDKLERYGEVYHRTRLLSLDEKGGWMTHAERIAYLEARFGTAIEAATRVRIAGLQPRPLLLDTEVERLMQEARAAGYDVVDARVCPASVAERMEALGVTNREVADRATADSGEVLSPSSVSEAKNGRPVSDSVKARVEGALSGLEADRLRKAV